MAEFIANVADFEFFFVTFSSFSLIVHKNLMFRDALNTCNSGTFMLLLSAVHLTLIIKRLALSSTLIHAAIQASVLILTALMCNCWQNVSVNGLSSKQQHAFIHVRHVFLFFYTMCFHSLGLVHSHLVQSNEFLHKKNVTLYCNTLWEQAKYPIAS